MNMHRDLAHEYDMRQLRRRQLEADIGDDYDDHDDEWEDQASIDRFYAEEEFNEAFFVNVNGAVAVNVYGGCVDAPRRTS